MQGNLTLKQLRAFLAVIEEQSFTRAAARLNLTQPAITAAIKALEVDVGLRLVDRSKRQVLATIHGERFAVTAARIIEQMEDAVEDLRAHAARERGLVAVATSSSFVEYVLAPALADLAALYPNIAVRLFQDAAAGSTRRVASGDVDLAVTTLPRPDPMLEAVPLVSDSFGVVCTRGHHLARGAQPLRWSQLKEEPTIGLGAQNGIRQVMDSVQTEGVELRRARHEVSSVSAIPSLIEAGLGIAVLPALAARPMLRSAGLTFRPLLPMVWRQIYIVKKPERAFTPAAAALVASIIQRVQALRADDVQPSESLDLLLQQCRSLPGP